MRYALSPKNTVIVRGPATATLLAGQATILGGPFIPHQPKTIANQKQWPIETESGAELEITLEKSGRIFEVQGSTIPVSWSVAAATVEHLREGRVMILGPPDVGKSTLCVYLVNKMLQAGQGPCVVDADLGQADMGPPTTIARAVPTQPIASLQELTPDRRLFIGHISPSGCEQKLIRDIHGLSAGGEKRLTIINTDGWVAGPDAVRYKVNLLTRLQPDLVLALAYSNELDPILSGVRFHSMTIAAAKETLERSRVDRRSIRTDAYRRFLEGAVTRRVSKETVQLSFPPGYRGVSIPDRRALSNLIVGILDNEGYLVQIGTLIRIDDEGVLIYSRPAEALHHIEVGHVKLSISGDEIGFL